MSDTARAERPAVIQKFRVSEKKTDRRGVLAEILDAAQKLSSSRPTKLFSDTFNSNFLPLPPCLSFPSGREKLNSKL